MQANAKRLQRRRNKNTCVIKWVIVSEVTPISLGVFQTSASSNDCFPLFTPFVGLAVKYDEMVKLRVSRYPGTRTKQNVFVAVNVSGPAGTDTAGWRDTEDVSQAEQPSASIRKILSG